MTLDRLSVASAWLCAVCTATGVARGQALNASSVLTNEVVVQLQPGHIIGPVASTFGATLAAEVPSRGLYLLRFTPGGPVPLAALAGDERVAWVEMNFVHVAPEGNTQSFFVSIAPSAYQNQYAIQLIGLPAAHQSSLGVGSTVAVLDTGLAPEVAQLGVSVLPGFNFIDNNTDTADVGNGLDDDGDFVVDEMVGHGTMVAGLVTTVAPAAALLPLKVLNSDGIGSSFYTAQGIFHAIDAGADVINLSLYSIKCSRIVSEAVEAAAAAGVLVVASVPNTGQQYPLPYPAALPDALAVAATDSADLKATFSGLGSYVDLSAPGVGVVSFLPGGGNGIGHGTSFATALVAGAAALVKPLLAAPDLSNLRGALFDTARDLSTLNPQYASLLGHGRIDVAGAAASAVGSGTVCDCNGDGALTVADFGCFQTKFLAGDPFADCNGDIQLTVADFGCFQTTFVLGCR